MPSESKDGVTAARIDEWLLESMTPSIEFNDMDGSSPQIRVTRTITRRRAFEGLISFHDSLGDFKSTITYQATAGKPAATISFKHKWMCTADGVVVEDHITGRGYHTQTWIYIDDFKDLDINDFK